MGRTGYFMFLYIKLLLFLRFPLFEACGRKSPPVRSNEYV